MEYVFNIIIDIRLLVVRVLQVPKTPARRGCTRRRDDTLKPVLACWLTRNNGFEAAVMVTPNVPDG
jgi:hypothetical protein